MRTSVYSAIVIIGLLLLSDPSWCLFEVQSPSDIAGEYLDSYLTIYPDTFDVTAQLILPEPLDICSNKPTNADKWTGKIVLVVDNQESCTPTDFARIILQENAKTAGQAIMCTGRSCAVLGYKAVDNKRNDKIILPSLNFKGQEILDFMQQSPETVVTLHMKSTDQNPWKEYGNGPAGKAYSTVLEIFSFICLICASWKLYAFVKFQGIDANITQISLAIEILVAIFRILYLPQPLSFGSIYLPVAVSEWFIETPNVLSLITTLLISFYWQEIILLVAKRLNNNLITSISKLRIPFFIVVLIILVLHVFSVINQVAFVATGIAGSAYTITAILQLIVIFCVSIFFFVVGYRIFRYTNTQRTSSGLRNLNRISLFIVSSACFMALRVLGIILYISPLSGVSKQAYLFVWWILTSSGIGISFTKIMAFEPPPNSGGSFSSYIYRPVKSIRSVFRRALGLPDEPTLTDTEPQSGLSQSGKSEELVSTNNITNEEEEVSTTDV